MDSRTLLPGTAFRARARLLGARLDLRNWPESETLAAYSFGSPGWA